MRGNDLTSLPFVSFTVIRTKEYFFHPVKNKENYYESFILIWIWIRERFLMLKPTELVNSFSFIAWIWTNFKNFILFIEGTRAGDPEECKSLDQTFCTNRKDPLLIGSVKSNMGHSEASSGICSVTKVLLAFEEGAIPANLYFQTPRKDAPVRWELK